MIDIATRTTRESPPSVIPTELPHLVKRSDAMREGSKHVVHDPNCWLTNWDGPLRGCALGAAYYGLTGRSAIVWGSEIEDTVRERCGLDPLEPASSFGLPSTLLPTATLYGGAATLAGYIGHIAFGMNAGEIANLLEAVGL